METWEIVLIVIGSVLALILIIIILLKCVIFKRKDDSDNIGTLIDSNMREMNEKN